MTRGIPYSLKTNMADNAKRFKSDENDEDDTMTDDAGRLSRHQFQNPTYEDEDITDPPEIPLPILGDERSGYDIYRPGTKRLVFGISNRQFKTPTLNRASAVSDDDYNVFSRCFGFECCSSKGKDFVINASKEDLEYELDYVRNRIENEKDVSCLAVILSSHGTERVVQGTVRSPSQREHFIICSDDQPFRTLEIIKRCQTKRNIPVIFVIQACRSEPSSNQQEDDSDKEDKGVSLVIVDEDSDADEDTPTRNSGGSEAGVTSSQPGQTDARGSGPAGDSGGAARYNFRGARPEEKRSLLPACAPHSVVFFAASEGKYAYRFGTKGSWLLYALDEKVSSLKDKGETEICLFDLFNGVNREIAAYETINRTNNKKHRLKSASSFLHQMTKKLILKFQPEEDDEGNSTT